MTQERRPLDPERENRALRKRVGRLERKIQNMEIVQQQTNSLQRALMRDLDAERAESDRLLLNILPESIARRLKSEPGVIADRFESASVLFADIVGFTPLSQALSAEQMVAWLNEVYSTFDALVQRHDVEKIRTIGDNYMVASGVPRARDDHAIVLTSLALDMRDYIESLPDVRGHKTSFRIGINSGPVVGGIIGTHKFQYDIWGDAVNTASRMESHGQPGRVHISAATHALVSEHFVCEGRGLQSIKGKGEMKTWFVEAAKPA
jgi:class 3 adenylate cyclase